VLAGVHTPREAGRPPELAHAGCAQGLGLNVFKGRVCRTILGSESGIGLGSGSVRPGMGLDARPSQVMLMSCRCEEPVSQAGMDGVCCHLRSWPPPALLPARAG